MSAIGMASVASAVSVSVQLWPDSCIFLHFMHVETLIEKFISKKHSMENVKGAFGLLSMHFAINKQRMHFY